jgi:hypothetical protein
VEALVVVVLVALEPLEVMGVLAEAVEVALLVVVVAAQETPLLLHHHKEVTEAQELALPLLPVVVEVGLRQQVLQPQAPAEVVMEAMEQPRQLPVLL